MDINTILQIGTLTAIGGLGWLIKRLIATMDNIKAELENQKQMIVELKHTTATNEDLNEHNKISKEGRKELWIEISKIKEKLVKAETLLRSKAEEVDRFLEGLEKVWKEISDIKEKLSGGLSKLPNWRRETD